MSMRILARSLFILLAPVLLTQCQAGDQASEQTGQEPTSFDDFFGGKSDTGYVGDKAVEIEAALNGKVFVDLTGYSEEERATFIAQVREDSTAVYKDITKQVKFAKNQLHEEKLNLNLERGNPVVLDMEEVSGGLWVSYTTQLDSLIKLKDLEAKGLQVADLVGKKYQVVLPADPQQIFARGGTQCASEEGQPVPEGELTEYNYFYYFDPGREGCPLKVGEELVAVDFEIRSSLDAPTVYPEYDLLTADNTITMVALFGQIVHGELKDNDPGWGAYKNWIARFGEYGFSRTAQLENDFGGTYEAEYPGGLKIIMNVYSPVALADHRPRGEVDELFSQVIKGHEIVYYNGHSFYGSLKVLDDPSIYPDRTYQIVFMDSCWSYAYYTRQVFLAKRTEEDPEGMKYVDVVNNTEPGISGRKVITVELYHSIFLGASHLLRGIPPVQHSWNNLVKYMNFLAEERVINDFHGRAKPEIFGVSGVRDNQYHPGEFSQIGVEVGADPETTIPDNDQQGISSTLLVAEHDTIGQVIINMDVEHTWNADLVVTLTHTDPNGLGQREVILFNRFGKTDGNEDLVISDRALLDFYGMDMQGEWTLNVKDVGIGDDIGVLKHWSIKIYRVAR